MLIEKLENKEGTVVLSHEKAEFKKNWDKILTICNEGGIITGKVKSIVKGGLVVNVGVEAFLPASQIDVTTPKNLAQFVGNSYEFKVVKINQERQNIVLSRRELIEAERNEKRRHCRVVPTFILRSSNASWKAAMRFSRCLRTSLNWLKKSATRRSLKSCITGTNHC